MKRLANHFPLYFAVAMLLFCHISYAKEGKGNPQAAAERVLGFFEGSIAVHEESMWALYRWQIIGTISLCMLEAGLIVALMFQRSTRRRAEKALLESQRMLQSTINSLNARVALLDQDGTVIAVNRRWEVYAEANRHTTGPGSGASRRQDDEERLVADALQRIKAGELEDFRCVYPSSHANGTTWFQLRVSRIEMQGLPRLVVTHEDVTEIKKAHDAQQELTGLILRAQDEERRRIARDLHDVTVQNVVAIKADIDVVRGDIDLRRPEDAAMLHESTMLCDQVIQELRTLSYVLHPPFLDEAGLVPALRWFVRGFNQRSGVQVDLLLREDVGRLPAEIETALFRVVQESLANIHRHSGSKRASIWITRNKSTVVLRIMDEGRGFSMPTPGDHESTSFPGVGIQGMRQRLIQLGGQLEIESSPEGTRVNARVTVSEERRAAHSTGR